MKSSIEYLRSGLLSRRLGLPLRLWMNREAMTRPVTRLASVRSRIVETFRLIDANETFALPELEENDGVPVLPLDLIEKHPLD